MSKLDPSELPDNFDYIIRIEDTDLDGLKKVKMALTGIKGVGLRTATNLCRMAEIDESTLAGLLEDDEKKRLAEVLDQYPAKAPLWMLNRQRDLETGEEQHLVGQNVTMAQEEDIAILRKIKCYRGLRHATGNRVRGQRTRSNARSGLTLGVSRKK